MFAPLLHSLDDAIPYVVLRNYDTLPETISNDLDILIHRESIVAVKSLLQSISRKQNWRLISTLRRYQYIGYRFTSSSGAAFQIDFYTGLVKAWIRYAHEATVLNSRIRHQRGFWVPDPAHEAPLIALKEFLTYRRCREKYHKAIQSYPNDSIPTELYRGLFSDHVMDKVRQGMRGPRSALLPFPRLGNFLTLDAVRWAIARTGRWTPA